MFIMRRKYVGLYEEPTSYRYEYVDYPRKSQKKPGADKLTSKLPQEDKPSVPVISTITANETLQRLDYEKRLPFCALWGPKHNIGPHVKPTFRRGILGDARLDEAIKTRPRVYMAPSVCIDNVVDPGIRKSMVDFTYQTPWSIACKEVWMNFKPRHPCAAYSNTEDRVKTLAKKKLESDLPLGFPSVARKWDRLNKRLFNVDASGHETDEYKRIKCDDGDLLTTDMKREISELIKEDKVSIIYDKFSPSYTGYRPQTALGVGFEKKNTFIS